MVLIYIYSTSSNFTPPLPLPMVSRLLRLLANYCYHFFINCALLLGYEEVHIHPKFQIKELLDSAKIKCESKDRVEWTKDDGDLPRQGLSLEDKGRILHIPQVDKIHNGEYKCSGTSYSGEPFLAYAKLFVGRCEFIYG